VNSFSFAFFGVFENNRARGKVGEIETTAKQE
jgi:hypothetical protein